jgi:cytochrome bd ubiquinol oxidase subunit I
MFRGGSLIMLEILSRLQFAFTAAFHFLFVPVSIGLIVPVAIIETKYYRTRDSLYKSLSNFWSEIFIVNYVIGIATGLTMAIQFGTNWAKYSVFMGDVFGSPLAFEALLAFFIESTFAGIWIFKRNSISAGLRLLTVWLIVLGTSISAIWILTANSFMQHPVGYRLLEDGSKVVLTSFREVILNPYVYWMFIHNHAAALLLGAFIMLAVSTYHINKKSVHEEGFRKSIRLALIIALITSVSLPILGDRYGRYVATIQPLKAAAMLNNLNMGNPDEVSGATLQGEEEAEGTSAVLLDTSHGVPNQTLVFTSFLIMVILGALFIIMVLIYLFQPGVLVDNEIFKKIAIKWLVPAGYVAITAGWIVTEAGRAPWLVYGLMTISDGISDIPVMSAVFSLFLIFVLYAILFVIDVFLIFKIIKRGPEQIGEEV